MSEPEIYRHLSENTKLGTDLPIALAVRAGEFIFVSGQAALGEHGAAFGNIVEQTEATINRIKLVLDEMDCDLADVVKATVWLSDARNFASFNKVFAKHFGAHPPARSTLVSQMVIDAKIEIEVVAYMRQ